MRYTTEYFVFSYHVIKITIWSLEAIPTNMKRFYNNLPLLKHYINKMFPY